MAEALEKVSELFTKIAAAKSAMAKAKEQWNNLQTHPNARQAVHGLDNDSQLDDVRTRFTAWHATGFSLCFAKVAPVAKYG